MTRSHLRVLSQHHTTDRRSNDMYDSTHDHQDTVNTGASRDYNPNDYAVHNQPTESSYQTSSFDNSTTGGTSHGIGSADTGMTGLHHVRVSQSPYARERYPDFGSNSINPAVMIKVPLWALPHFVSKPCCTIAKRRTSVHRARNSRRPRL